MRHFICIFVLLFSGVASADDWPQFLGPHRDGEYAGKAAIVDSFPAAGPTIAWKKKIGDGYATPVIVGGKLIVFHRVAKRNVLECFNAATSDLIWSAGYETRYRDGMGKGDGPRSTPTIADGKVFAFGPDGVLICVALADGKELWQQDTQKEFKSPAGFFGRACSPVVEDGLVLLNIGAPEAGIGAFDAKTGELRWKATGDEASYASPVVASIKNQHYAFFYTRTGLVATDPKSGDILFQHRWRSQQHASVNAASPLVIGNIVFLSSSYETGATALAIDGKKVETLWSGDNILSSQYANIVHKDGFLYGFDGRNDFGDTRLRCVDLKTGAIKWTQDSLAAGPIIVAGDKLIIVLESGELMLVAADPAKYKLLAKSSLLSNPVRAHPALADGFLYARDNGQLICVDLRKK